jgi:membrane-associated phospholipid phosphatase
MTLTPNRTVLARSLVASVLLALSASSLSRAQGADSVGQSPDSLAPPSAAHLTRRDVTIAGGIAVAGITLVPFDAALTRRLRSPDVQRSTAWHNGAVVFDWYGAPGAMYAGPVLTLAGSAWRSAKVSDVGIHITESYATAAIVTFAIKGFAGRARPYTYAVNQETAYDFRAGRGFPHREPYSSFPSGHATGSFAFASAITSETSRHWPRHARLVGALAYGGAFLDGVSRVYRDTHWPSDVAAGALIGTMSGLLVTRYQHARPGNRLDALARRVTFAPSPDGNLLARFSKEF